MYCRFNMLNFIQTNSAVSEWRTDGQHTIDSPGVLRMYFHQSSKIWWLILRDARTGVLFSGVVFWSPLIWGRGGGCMYRIKLELIHKLMPYLPLMKILEDSQFVTNWDSHLISASHNITTYNRKWRQSEEKSQYVPGSSDAAKLNKHWLPLKCVLLI
jgi:hypothetical protein